MKNYQAPSNQKAIVEKPGKLLLTPQPTYVRKSGEAETQTVERKNRQRAGMFSGIYYLDEGSAKEVT